MPHFVIQQHETDQGIHWDLMLEDGQRLATWQVPVHPGDWLGGPIFCKQLPNHRPIYLTYEGQISNNRGWVHIICRGDYQKIDVQDRKWIVNLKSTPPGQNDKYLAISGQLLLELTEDDNWRLVLT